MVNDVTLLAGMLSKLNSHDKTLASVCEKMKNLEGFATGTVYAVFGMGMVCAFMASKHKKDIRALKDEINDLNEHVTALDERFDYLYDQVMYPATEDDLH